MLLLFVGQDVFLKFHKGRMMRTHATKLQGTRAWTPGTGRFIIASHPPERRPHRQLDRILDHRKLSQGGHVDVQHWRRSGKVVHLLIESIRTSLHSLFFVVFYEDWRLVFDDFKCDTRGTLVILWIIYIGAARSQTDAV